MGQIKNIKLHIVTDIKNKLREMESTSSKEPSVMFKVQKILGMSLGSGNVRTYQVQWEPVWVSGVHLVGCEHLIHQFLEIQKEEGLTDKDADHFSRTESTERTHSKAPSPDLTPPLALIDEGNIVYTNANSLTTINEQDQVNTTYLAVKIEDTTAGDGGVQYPSSSGSCRFPGSVETEMKNGEEEEGE